MCLPTFSNRQLRRCGDRITSEEPKVKFCGFSLQYITSMYNFSLLFLPIPSVVARGILSSMHLNSSPRCSYEDAMLKNGLEESLLSERTSRTPRHRHYVRYINIFFTLLNILAAIAIYLGQSRNLLYLPSTTADYRTQCLAKPVDQY